MKKVYIIITTLILLVSCSKDGDNPTEPEVLRNNPPSVPVPVYPLNNTVCIDSDIKFEWDASKDFEDPTLTYKIEVSESSTFTTLLNETTSTAISEVISLPAGQTYFWRIKAIDSDQAESAYSPSQRFITEGEGISNHIPFTPTLIAPALNEEIDGLSTTLSWTSSDVDMDALTFDIYLDTNSEPTTKVSENQTEMTYLASNLSAATTYYFKVVVKDSQGGVSIGQIWSFKTK